MAAPTITNPDGYSNNRLYYFDVKKTDTVASFTATSITDSPFTTTTSLFYRTDRGFNASQSFEIEFSSTTGLTSGAIYQAGVAARSGARVDYSAGKACIFVAVSTRSSSATGITAAPNGYYIGLLSGSAYKVWGWGGNPPFLAGTQSFSGFGAGGSGRSFYGVIIDPNAGNTDFSGGTFNNTNVNRLEVGLRPNTTGTVLAATGFDMALTIPLNQIVEGEVGNPAKFDTVQVAYSSTATADRIILFNKLGSSQYYSYIPLSIGNGSTFTYFVERNISLQFGSGAIPTSYQHIVADNFYTLIINLADGSTCDIAGASISCDRPFEYTITRIGMATTNFNRVSVIGRGNTTLLAGYVQDGGSFFERGEIQLNGAILTNVLISDSTGVSAALLTTTSTLTGVTIRGSDAAGVRVTSAGDYSNIEATIRDSTTYDVLITSAVTTGTIDLSGLTFPSDSTTPTNIRWDGTSGSITVIVGQTGVTTSTAGGTITLQQPTIALNAPNFAENTRVQVQRVESYTVAATDVNTSTDQITVTGNQFTASTFPTLVVILKGSGTLPTSTPQVINRGLYYVVAKSGDAIQISKTEGGTPINFTAQGSSSFTVAGYTELANGLAGSSGYSTTLSESNGALLQVKARYWAEVGGVATASTFFQSTYVWSTASGVTIADSVSVTESPDTVHNAIANASTIVLPDGSTITPADSGADVTGFAFEADGLVEIDIDDEDGRFLIQDAYLWFVYASASEAGIRLTNNFNFRAEDLFNYVLQDVQLESISTVPVFSVGGYVRSANSLSLVSNQSNPLHLNSDQKGVAISIEVNSGSGLSSEQSTQLSNLAATLQTSGVFSTAALANAPAGGGGDSVWTTTQRDQVLDRTARVNGLIEDSGGDRFTLKALEQSREAKPYIDTE